MGDTLLIKGLKDFWTPENPPDLQRPVDILIRDGHVQEIGHGLNVPDAECVDGTGCVAIPGLVNTHHHFYQTLTRAIPRMQNARLFPWLVDHYRVWAELSAEAVYWGSLTAMGELLLTGCTCTTDHHYLFPHSATPELIDAQFRAAQQLGMRFVATRGSMSVGQSKGGLPPDHVVQTEEEILADCRRLIKTYHDPAPDSMRRIALAPCSPFSVSKDLMRQSAELARETGVRLHTHLAETLDEEQYCLREFGCRPVELMKQLDWIGPDVWFAHCVHLSGEEIQLFGDNGVGVAHCPSSNMRLASGIAPVKELLKAGAPVGIAVDGSASNDASDMLGEVRNALLLQRVQKDAGALTARSALRMAGQGGARVLGHDRLGQIRPGFPADIAVFRVDGLEFTGVHDDIAGLLFCGISHRAEHVLVQGRTVVSRGKLVNMREQHIRSRAHAIAEQLLHDATEKTGIDYRKYKASSSD